jgi:hypothetical protein
MESWFKISRADQSEILKIGNDKTNREEHLLEKDIWVVCGIM